MVKDCLASGRIASADARSGLATAEIGDMIAEGVHLAAEQEAGG